MSPETKGVLITYQSEGINPANPKRDAFGTSGILLSSRYILTHGSLLLPELVTSNSTIKDYLNDSVLIFHSKSGIQSTPRQISSMIQLITHLEDNSRKIVTKPCSWVGWCRCPLLNETFNRVLFSWNFQNLQKSSNDFNESLLSIFLVLEIDGHSAGSNDITSAVKEFYQNQVANLPEVHRGSILEIAGTPFGNPEFMDTVSRGILSNMIGRDGCVILTDANSVPGCEGAPVYELDPEFNRRIRGLVIAPLSWCRGEWVDFTFAVNLKPCLQRLIFNESSAKPDCSLTIAKPSQPYRFAKKSAQILTEKLDRSLVMVKCRSGWGTGIVVDVRKGIILTCSHVVRGANDDHVTVVSSPSSQSNSTVAKIIYRTLGDQPFDIAILKCENSEKKCLNDFLANLEALELSSKPPKIGEKVITAGFPFFEDVPITISTGNVSRISENTIMQTTCCVQSGTSGGPVVSYDTGQILAMMVSNAVSASGSRILYPRFNMAIPSTVFKEPIRRYVETGEIKELERLCSKDEAILKAWNFYLTPRSKM